jgi:hypothetical protein
MSFIQAVHLTNVGGDKMFIYHSTPDKHVHFEPPTSTLKEYTIQVQNKTIYVFEFLGKDKGVLVLSVYDNEARMCESVYSTIPLKPRENNLENLDCLELRFLCISGI